MTDPYGDEEIGGLGSGPRYPSGQQEEALRLVVEAARRQLSAQHRREVHQLATILANTRPNDHGTEGEWALRLHEAGVRPPRTRPKPRS